MENKENINDLVALSRLIKFNITTSAIFRLISLVLPSLPKLPNQCFSDGLGNLGNLGCSREI